MNCINFTGYKDKAGYGRKRQGDKNCYAHRVAWMKHNNVDEIPKDKVVMHLCNNPSCINPKHLMLGTRSQNTQMMYALGRHNRKPRELKPSCKHGHKMTQENTYINSQGSRICLKCKRISQKKYDMKRSST